MAATIVGKVWTEFLGTLFLCLTVALAGKSSPIAPIAIGCVLMVLVYAGGHVSGANYNPAVTVALLVRGGGVISALDAVLYIISQVAGAISATLLAWVLIGSEHSAYPAPAENVHALAAITCEAVITFALCSVVLHTATTEANKGNSFFGLAIGFTVLSGAVSVGGISGGAFNPAVGTMTALYGKAAMQQVWIYWVAPILGGVVAGLLFRITAIKELKESTEDSSKIELLASCLNEMIGTMMLCFTVGTAAGAPSDLTPLSIGSMLMVMIYMGGWVSGAHYNPAVTFAVYLRTVLAGKNDFDLAKMCFYMLAQLLGAGIAVVKASFAMGGIEKVGYPSLAGTADIPQGIIGETLGTFLLAYVVLSTATVKKTTPNAYFGLAIGMVVTAMACSIGPITGGAFNPAVGMMGPFSLGHGGPIRDAWIYWVGCLFGAFLAACSFKVQNPEEFQAEGVYASMP